LFYLYVKRRGKKLRTLFVFPQSQIYIYIYIYIYIKELLKPSPQMYPIYLSLYIESSRASRIIFMEMKSFQMANATKPLSLSPNFVLPEDKRPQLAQISSLASIPVIDLSDDGNENGGGPSGFVQKISQACEEYGFFQIINHGVPEELCDKTMTAITEFFQLPPEERSEFFTEDHRKRVKLFNYYLKVEGPEKVRMWSECLLLSSLSSSRRFHPYLAIKIHPSTGISSLTCCY
jgi:hypothetical protein